MDDVETCCGFGGTFAVKFDAISIAMADQKLNNAVATNAEYIISTDLSCLLHIEGCIKSQEPVAADHAYCRCACQWLGALIVPQYWRKRPLVP
jgi:Fe-S oxidoreductase